MMVSIGFGIENWFQKAFSIRNQKRKPFFDKSASVDKSLVTFYSTWGVLNGRSHTPKSENQSRKEP